MTRQSRSLIAILFYLFFWCVAFAVLGVAGLGLSAYYAPDFWFSDNMSFFQRQFLGAGVLGCIAGALGILFLKRLRTLYLLVWAIGLTLLCALAWLTYERTQQNTLPLSPADANAKTIRIVSANIEYRFLGDKGLQNYLADVDADIVLFQETLWWLQERRWRQLGEPLSNAGQPGFPEHLHVGKLGSIVVYSRFPILEASGEVIRGPIPDGASVYHNSDREIIRLKVQTPDGPLILFAIHSESPRSKVRWEAKQNYFEALDEKVADDRSTTQDPIIIIGDWNSSPWSSRFQTSLKANALKTAYPDGWPQTTRFFFDYRLHWILGAVVDHFAASGDVKITDVSLGPDIGSDHLPLEVELQLSGRQKPE